MRGRSASPLANVPLSKRDKRRNALQERLQDLTASFSQNRDTHFRQQLHALQCDMTLINNADPYFPSPLPDSADEIARLIENTVGGGKFAREMASLAGLWYSRFVQEINMIKEDKDAELALLMHRHQDCLRRLLREYKFREHFAQEESRLLSLTLRERLVQSISLKKSRLMKEKEQLDLADANALLLHPSQFSITNPASPNHGNRKTRHTRQRIELDELGNSIMSDTHGKRKRKLLDDEVGSPVRDAGFATPAERARLHLAQQQQAPAYSIYSLFTEKELSFHANSAHVSTVHFFSTSKRGDQLPGTATNGDNTDVEDTSGVGDGTGAEDNGTPAATDMIRTASQNFHATRSTRTNASNALSVLAELSDKTATRPTLPYHILGNYQTRTSGNAPQLASLMNDEIDDDCARMDRLAAKPAGWMDRNLVEVLVSSSLDDADGEPQNPDRFSLLHPDFPVDMGVHWVPLRKSDGDGFTMFGTKQNERSKRARAG